METQSRITPQQLEILNRYTCERLTASSENQQKIFGFFCDRNKHLAYHLRSDAWYEDKDNCPTVYYVVKNPQGQIALYFSLKCGVLFDPNYVRDVIDRYENNKELMAALENEECQEWAKEHIEQLRGGHRFVPGRKAQNIRSEYYEAKHAWKYLVGDEEKEPNDRIIRVDEAFPAIELVHFCVNDAARGQWKSLNLGHTMGECMFWHFVVPKMLEIRRLIGCEYAYLFAADSTKDGTLLNYYETVLHFDQMKHIGAIKPEYDFFCIFMCKRLSQLSVYRRNCLEPGIYANEEDLGLTEYRDLFYENFNIVAGDDAV